MRKRKPVKKADQSLAEIAEEFAKLRQEIKQKQNYMDTHLEKLWEYAAITNERLQDVEVYVNLLSRLITTLSLEKLGINMKSLKTLLQRIEKEAIADSQIQDLEEMFRAGEKKLPSEKLREIEAKKDEGDEQPDSEDVVYFGDEEKESPDDSDIDEDMKGPGDTASPDEE